MDLPALLLLSLLPAIALAQARSTAASFPTYEGNDLGMTYSPERTRFRIWAPTAERAFLHLYESGLSGKALQTHELQPDTQGTFLLTLEGDLEGRYYTFQVEVGGRRLPETPDPWAVAAGANGRRAMVVDLRKTDPPGWENDRGPTLPHPTDAVIYELHLRDLSTHPSAGIRHRGKYLGLTERGTRSPEGLPTGLDHIRQLGVTHIHLLPVFDFASIDETKLDAATFNWGYDPHLFNVPEGSYSTDPFDGRVRIREFKQMVKALHDHGIGVIMDVVYNHVHAIDESPFQRLVPGYFFR
ncbi:MAG: type I pullulanase, partial [Bacteroidetes bacterium]